VAFVPPRKLPIPLRLLAFVSPPAILILFGTIGYRLTEGWKWFDAFYIAVITLTSIGYGDKHAFSTAGRVLTLVLALGGISTVAIAAAELLGTLLTGEIHDFVGQRRMKRKIDGLRQHVIICGYGHVGEQVCAQLLRSGVPVVVIDRRDAVLTTLLAARDVGAHVVVGDAAADATLQRAAIGRARALITVAGSDADNVLITMTARSLRPDLMIVARVEDAGAVPNLVRAGATRTVSLRAIAGRRMAQAVLRPAVLDLIEEVAGHEHPDLRMEEQLVRPGSLFDGKTVGTSGLRSWHGLMLVAIKRGDGHMIFDPDDDASIGAGDILIILGHQASLERAEADALAFSH
jgi:voltage-gated potassium channel